MTVSRTVIDQLPKVEQIQKALACSLNIDELAPIALWDDYFAPQYGMPNEEGMAAVQLLAQQEGVLLDPVYTGKAMAGLIDGIAQRRFRDEGPILFVHTGGAPAVRLPSAGVNTACYSILNYIYKVIFLYAGSRTVKVLISKDK